MPSAKEVIRITLLDLANGYKPRVGKPTPDVAEALRALDSLTEDGTDA